jgi:hypothetical protein
MWQFAEPLIELAKIVMALPEEREVSGTDEQVTVRNGQLAVKFVRLIGLACGSAEMIALTIHAADVLRRAVAVFLTTICGHIRAIIRD